MRTQMDGQAVLKLKLSGLCARIERDAVRRGMEVRGMRLRRIFTIQVWEEIVLKWRGIQDEKSGYAVFWLKR